MQKQESRINILMVDDRPENLVSLGAILDSPSYHLVRATSGEAALRALLDEEFALILLDVQMPGLDGFDTAALVKQRPRTRHIPIIFITANSQDEKFIYRGYDAGAVDYILKPIAPDILRSKVAVFADLHSKTRQLLRQAELLRENERLERERQIARLEAENARREKAANQRFRDLVSGLRHVIVWAADPETFVPTYVSEHLKGILGREGAAHLGNLSMLETVVVPEDRQAMLAILRRAVESREEQVLEHRMLSRSGEERWFQTSVRMGDRSDRPGREELRGVSVDITSIKQAEEVARETARTREEFLSVASHELKTPLTSLKLQLQSARRFLGKTPEAMVERMPAITERCERQVDRLTRLVDELLDAAKISRSRLELNPATFDLSQLARDIAARLALDLAQAGCEPNLKIAERIEGSWDHFRLDQVVTNLLTNAMKYGPSAPIDLSVETDGENAVLRVRDHGIGIAPSEQERIFGRFERATGQGGPSGLGLGLFIARQIVLAHRGTLTVESEPGKGSTFTVRLPLRAPEQERATSAPDSEPWPELSLAGGSRSP